MEVITDCRHPATRDAVFVGAAQYRRHSYGSNHPLSIPRVSLTFDLINAYGALTRDEYVVGRAASEGELGWFHTADYVGALQRSEALGRVRDEDRRRHNIGTVENPYFPDFFRTPALATGSSVQAAEEVLRGRCAFNPAGGMHHASPDRAEGFCYFNDAVLAILRLRQEGLRVLYLDVDAHHGDGVERAFRDDPEVFTLSLHMDTVYAYPFKGGQVGDHGSARGGHACLNVPLPRDTNDREYSLVFEALFPFVLREFAPDAVVLQAGTDVLFADPLGKLQISTQAFLGFVAQVVEASPRLLVLGGGGYHPLLLARCWAGLWGLISGRALPEALPARGAELLRMVEWDYDEDEPHFASLFESRLDALPDAPVRPEIDQLLSAIRAEHPRMKALG